ncbi:MAG: hypothetical protein ACI9RU_003230 [Litorivivens sp.]|jgi:hypothetical protein
MKKSFLLIIFFIVSNTMISQQLKVTRDIGAWAGVSVEKKLFKDFEIRLDQQLRLYTNATELDDYFIDLGGKYKINKNFKLGANFRFTYDQKRRKASERNYRYNFDINYRIAVVKKLAVSYRLRYQREYVNLLSEDQSTSGYSAAIRNRLKLKYELNKNHRIYVSGELFRRFESFRDPYFNKMRLFLGDEIRTEIGEFDVSLGYELETNATYPLSFFFVRVIYSLGL